MIKDKLINDARYCFTRIYFLLFLTGREYKKSEMWSNHIIIFCTLWSHLSGNSEDELKHHKRTKRFLWMTHEKRLVLPPVRFKLFLLQII